MSIVELRGAGVRHRTGGGFRDLDLDVAAGETVGLAGPSGAGKTSVARAVVGLLPLSTGSLRVDGRPVGRRRTAAQRRSVQLTFQDAAASFDPRRAVGTGVADGLTLAGVDTVRHGTEIAELLTDVGVDPRLADRRPDQLSGGQLQRVGLARALACRPRLLVCDEVTSALDVSARAGVLNLLSRLRTERDLALLVITHDRAVLDHLCHRVVELRPEDR